MFPKTPAMTLERVSVGGDSNCLPPTLSFHRSTVVDMHACSLYFLLVVQSYFWGFSLDQMSKYATACHCYRQGVLMSRLVCQTSGLAKLLCSV